MFEKRRTGSEGRRRKGGESKRVTEIEEIIGNGESIELLKKRN
jgi:hypothetical protein